MAGENDGRPKESLELRESDGIVKMKKQVEVKIK